MFIDELTANDKFEKDIFSFTECAINSLLDDSILTETDNENKIAAFMNKIKTFIHDLIEKIKDHINTIKKKNQARIEKVQLQKTCKLGTKLIRENPDFANSLHDAIDIKEAYTVINREITILNKMISSFIKKYTSRFGMNFFEGQIWCKKIEDHMNTSNKKIKKVTTTNKKMKASTLINNCNEYVFNDKYTDITKSYLDMIKECESELSHLEDALQAHADEAGYMSDKQKGVNQIFTLLNNATVYVKRNVDWIVPSCISAVLECTRLGLAINAKSKGRNLSKKEETVSNIASLGSSVADSSTVFNTAYSLGQGRNRI